MSIRTSRHAQLVALVLVLLGSSDGGLGQVSPNGVQVQVNSYTTGNQRWPDVDAGPVGPFVVVWDSSITNVRAQRFDANGSMLGLEFGVNSLTSGDSRAPVVASDSQGDFVAAWHSYASNGTDSLLSSIQARLFAADGSAVADQFQVNQFTSSRQNYPAVAMQPSGDFVVAWQSKGSLGSDTSFVSIQARRYQGDGAPLSAEFQVNTYTTSYQLYPKIASDSEGNFVVVWLSWGSNGSDADLSSIQARQFLADGTPLGGEFQVNSYTTSIQYFPSIARGGDGSFVVAWQSLGSDGTDSSSYSIQARRFDSTGSPIGAEFQVNTYTSFEQLRPEVTTDSQGTFVVVWDSNGSFGSDTDMFSIQGRRYATDGAALGTDFQVNAITTSGQHLPAVAMDAKGNFEVVWHSDTSGGDDSDGTSIQLQRFDALFRDGFESGDVSRWSIVNPD